jgi:multidrug efflux system membrane fusion protein
MNTSPRHPFSSYVGARAGATRPAHVSAIAFPTILFLGLLSLSACARTAAQQGAPPPPKVTTATVISRDVKEWDEFTGRLEAVNSVAVRPRVSGFVAAVRFHEGAVVRKGDLLFQIDPRPFQAEADRLKAELLRARATVRRATSELQRAERLATENAMSHEERERRASFAEESAAQVAATEAGLRAAELNLEFTRVTAPIDGRVSRAIITEGNLVSSGPGEATILTTVVSLDPIYASFDADEQTFLRYGDLAREGKRASARQSGLPIVMALASDQDFPREGEMNFLDNQMDPATGTIRGRAIFRNKDHGLTPGLFVRLRLPGTGSYRGVLIQDRAVGTDLDKRFVLVVGADKKVQYRTVTLGPIIDNLRVVRTGLQPGDIVVVNGLQRVRPGMQVEPETIAMDRPIVAPGTKEASVASAGDTEAAAKSEPAKAERK